MTDVKVLNYVNRKDKFVYENFFCNVKAKDSFVSKFDIMKLTYNDVKNIYKKLSDIKCFEDIMEIFVIAYKCKDYNFWNMKISNFFMTKKFLIKTFVQLQKNEEKLLHSIDKNAIIYQNIAGDRLKAYNLIMPLDRIAKIYGGYPLDYGNKKYLEILTLLGMNKTLSEIEKEFNQIKK